MIIFNSTTPRYRFIYLTKNIYDGIAVKTMFEQCLWDSELLFKLNGEFGFVFIDNYIDLIPFALRFDNTYDLKCNVFQSDIILSLNSKTSRRMIFSHVLFFVDTCKPDKTSFLYLYGIRSVVKLKERLDFFLRHCCEMEDEVAKSQTSDFLFTQREQQIIFHLLEGLSVKEISHLLEVSDKTVYKDKVQLISKLIQQEKINKRKGRGK